MYLKIVLGLFPITVEEEAPAKFRTEIAAVTRYRTVAAEEATTDHARLQLQLDDLFTAFHATARAVSGFLFHVQTVYLSRSGPFTAVIDSEGRGIV